MSTQVKSIYIGLILSVFLLVSSLANASCYRARIDGMYCNFCSGPLVKKIKRINGVKSVSLHLKSGVLVIRGDSNVRRSSISSAINSSSYKNKGITKC
jgi:copper chaperone CopZ